MSIQWTLVQAIAVATYKIISDLRAWIRVYGPFSGLAVGFFSKKSVWDVLVKVLGSPYPRPYPEPAFQLKKILEDESGRIGLGVGFVPIFLVAGVDRRAN
jgi:hypothetical protein